MSFLSLEDKTIWGEIPLEIRNLAEVEVLIRIQGAKIASVISEEKQISFITMEEEIMLKVSTGVTMKIKIEWVELTIIKIISEREEGLEALILWTL